MSSVDERQSSVTSGFQLPGLVDQLSPVEQLPFPENFPPLRTPQLAEPQTSTLPGFTGKLPETSPLSNPTVRLPETFASSGTGWVLPELNTGEWPVAKSTTTSLRQPVVIPGTGKKSTGILRPPPRGRRWVIQASVLGVILLLGLITSISVIPVDGQTGHGFNPFQSVVNLVQSNSGNPNLIAQQAAATATALTHQDGYDPGHGQPVYTSSGGVASMPLNGSGLNGFAFGQCTYWANMRYHELTGYWVAWIGNAYQWSYGASMAGWIVSSRPHVPSIIVLSPGVEGAGSFGHVAVVERINSDGSVWTSNYNWYDGGGWDRLSYYTFYPGPGVSFVYHP